MQLANRFNYRIFHHIKEHFNKVAATSSTIMTSINSTLHKRKSSEHHKRKVDFSLKHTPFVHDHYHRYLFLQFTNIFFFDETKAEIGNYCTIKFKFSFKDKIRMNQSYVYYKFIIVAIISS
jgi:hypothetical protein